jgi:hypothetical protein
MRPREAKQIILDEARSEDSIVVELRMGRDPGKERMGRLIEAIKVLFDRIEGQDKILRDVAAALYVLGTEVPAQIESWSRNGPTWRADLVDRELVNLLYAVESMFEGEWLGDTPEENLTE